MVVVQRDGGVAAGTARIAGTARRDDRIVVVVVVVVVAMVVVAVEQAWKA